MSDYTLDTSGPKVQRAARHERRYQAARQGRTQRAERQTIRQESRPYRAAGAARTAASTPGRVANATTSYSGNRVLAAELMVAFAIVAIRVVADYESQADGTKTGKVLHPKGQYGPLPILGGLVMAFFALSFVAIGGGTRAKVAVILGGTIVTTLGLKSVNEIKTVSGTIGKVGTITIPGESGSEGSGASNTNTAAPADTTSPAAAPATSQTTSTQPGKGGIFPTPTGAAPPQYLPGSAGGSGNNAVSNAQQAATRALAAAVQAADSSKTGKGFHFVEGVGKAIADESTAAVDQITSTIKGWFGG